MTQRHVRITSGSSTVFDGQLGAAVGEALVRALELHQRSLELPDDEAGAEAALIGLDQLVKQLDSRLNELIAHAGAAHQTTIRQQAEESLNLPVSKLLAPLPSLYEAEL